MSSSLIAPDFQVIAKNLPHLVERNRWLVWKFEMVGGKLTKPPRSARTSATIDIRDEANLVSFEEARAAYEAGGFSGVGYSLAEGDLALDLDNCRNPQTGGIDQWAIDIFEESKAYCEFTPSGTGSRVIGTGVGPKINKNLTIPDSTINAHLEIFRSAERYITITGQQIEQYEHYAPRNIDAVADGLLQTFGCKTQEALRPNGNGHAAPDMQPDNVPLPDEDDLDPAMMTLLRWDAQREETDRSAAFHQVVTGLRDENGLVPAQIETLMRRYPNGIAEKYNGRLRKAIEASWRKVRNEVCDVRREENGDIVDHSNGQVLYDACVANDAAYEPQRPEPHEDGLDAGNAGGDGGDDEIGELPDELTRLPGLLGDVIDYINDTARQPNRVLAMGAAVTVLGTLVGRRLAGPTLSGTHLYILTLAPSGAGKDHAQRRIPRLLRAASAAHLLGPEDFMSQSGVLSLLSRKPLCVAPMDEFGAFLKRISNKRAGGHEKAVTKTMRSAWGVSFETMMTPEWGGRPAEEIWAPALSIYGTSTAEDFFSSLQAEDVVNGFLNRFLLLKTDTLNADSEPKLDPLTVPDDLGLRLKRLYVDLNPILAGQTKLYETEALPHKTLPWGPGAEDVFKLMKDDIGAIRKNSGLDPFFARTAEMAVRLAAIASVEDECVSRAVMIWGRDLAMWSAHSVARAAGEHMAENDRASKAKQVLKFLKGRSKPTTRAEIRRHIGQGLDARTMTDILETLVEGGDVITQPQVASVRGGPKPKYPKYSARVRRES